MIKRIRCGIISGAAAALTLMYAYLYAFLPFNLNAETGAAVDGAGFSPVKLVSLESGTRYFLGNIPIKRAVINEQERRYVVPSGEPFGIKIMSDGVMVVDTSSGSPAEKAGIRRGDVITSVNGKEVFTNAELSAAIEQSNECANIVFERDGSEICAEVYPVSSGGSAMIGAWVRDSAAGIGTLTFIDPETGTFGGLGHAVSDPSTGAAVGLRSGEITEAEIYDIIKGEKGAAGELCGAMTASSEIGKISANTPTGVFGNYSKEIGGEALPMAFRQEVKTGAATILTTIEGSEPKEYSIEIERINLPDLFGSKAMLIKITDPELLEKTGGIVRGMSGSPIIQDGRLAGAVTHVLVSDPTRGYAVFAESMR